MLPKFGSVWIWDFGSTVSNFNSVFNILTQVGLN